VAAASAKTAFLAITTAASALPKLNECPTVPLDVHIPSSLLFPGIRRASLFDRGGKLIRPLLVIYSGNLFSYKSNNDLIKAAVAAELIHMASLVHDDIIDNTNSNTDELSE